jgi:hypothetical protein
VSGERKDKYRIFVKRSVVEYHFMNEIERKIQFLNRPDIECS